MSTKIEQISTILAQYYKFHGVDHKGKFQLWVEQNDMESEEIEIADPNDSILTEFDSKFPSILQSNKDQENQRFKVLKKLADTFSRDPLSYHYQYKDSKEWAPTLDEDISAHQQNSPIFRNIKSESQRAQYMLAIRSFHSRLVPNLMLTDSVEETAALFVHALSEQQSEQQKMLPFQIDITIGYKKTRILEKQVMPGNDDDDDDDDYDYDYKHSEWYDCIADVEDKLKTNNIVSVKREIDEGLGTDKYPFDDFKRKLQNRDFIHDRKSYQSHIENEVKNEVKNEGFFELAARKKMAEAFRELNSKLTDVNKKTYPGNHRFNMIVDRRERLNKDELVVVEPPRGCNKLSDVNIAECYFDLSRQCLIPRKGYIPWDARTTDDKVNLANAVEKQTQQSKKLNTQTIDAAQGKILTCSLHVWGGDEVKRYRFYPQNILELLPHLFVKSDKNKGKMNKEKKTSTKIEYNHNEKKREKQISTIDFKKKMCRRFEHNYTCVPDGTKLICTKCESQIVLMK